MNLSRQSDLIPANKLPRSVAIIGLGGIGSNAAITLASMGVEEFHLIDPDWVAIENVGPQSYTRAYTDLPKPIALSDQIERINPQAQIQRYHRHFPFDDLSDLPLKVEVVLLGLDSLYPRKLAWNAITGDNKQIETTWLLDGRMGQDTATLYTINLNDPVQIELYQKSLELKPRPTPCGMKATAFITKGILAGLIGQTFFQISHDIAPPAQIQYSAFAGELAKSKTGQK